MVGLKLLYEKSTILDQVHGPQFFPLMSTSLDITDQVDQG